MPDDAEPDQRLPGRISTALVRGPKSHCPLARGCSSGVGRNLFLPLTIEGLALPLGLAFEPNDVRMDE
jgi:hypothetical protein